MWKKAKLELIKDFSFYLQYVILKAILYGKLYGCLVCTHCVEAFGAFTSAFLGDHAGTTTISEREGCSVLPPFTKLQCAIRSWAYALFFACWTARLFQGQDYFRYPW